MLRTVRMVLLSISSATAPEAAKIAMNKLAKNSVDNPNSRKSLLSSLIVYIERDGLTTNKNTAAIMMTE